LGHANQGQKKNAPEKTGALLGYAPLWAGAWVMLVFNATDV
jgi:hypothetical protein